MIPSERETEPQAPYGFASDTEAPRDRKQSTFRTFARTHPQSRSNSARTKRLSRTGGAARRGVGARARDRRMQIGFWPQAFPCQARDASDLRDSNERTQTRAASDASR